MHLAFFLLLIAQANDPAYPPLDRAYAALRAGDLDRAVAAFEEAIRLAPARPGIRKDFAYTLLKTGETEAARDQFAEAMRLDPTDDHVAMEYAFLCFETKERVTARRVFGRIRKTGNATAEQAFQNIDRPLAEGIARWTQALARDPGNFSAHQELATLAEQRDQLEMAAEHYRAAWRLRPEIRSLLVDLGRVLKELQREEEAVAALLAASRGAEPRAAESARALLPPRYPFVYEFRKALALDPQNVELRRELAYLLLQMERREEAEVEFTQITESDPADRLSAAQLGFLRLSRNDTAGAMPLLERVLRGPDDELADRVRSALQMPQTLRRRPEVPRSQVSLEAKTLASRSLEAGYLQDALKYLTIAHEADPVDFEILLKLGWTQNILKDDREALKWFNLARKSPDPAIRTEASRAYSNLRPNFSRWRATFWVHPLYSSRWRDVFVYGQAKLEVKLANLPVRPYATVRFIGDTRGELRPGPGLQPQYWTPQYLSESAAIAGLGVSTQAWQGLMGWFEGGAALNMRRRTDVAGATSDFRGGLSYSKGIGHLLGGRGWFAETADDGVFVSRFANDLLLYSQNRAGRSLAFGENFAAQLFWGWNVTADRLGEYWANFVEAGPGLRLRFPARVMLTIHGLRGNYFINRGNPGKPYYYDLRIGVWYAATR